MSFEGADPRDCYRAAMEKSTLDEAVAVIIKGDPMNWVLHGHDMLKNIEYVFARRVFAGWPSADRVSFSQPSRSVI